MELLPPWAPNAHPLVVHFPIALFFTALLFDAIALVPWKRTGWAQPAAVALFVTAGLAAFVAYLTGRAAADSVLLPAEAQSVLSEHADLGTWTVWALGIYAVVRLALAWWKTTLQGLVRAILFLVALGGSILVWQTAEHGAMLVFRYGAGVQAMGVDGEPGDEHGDHPEATETESVGPVFSEDGSWHWAPKAGATAALAGTTFRWLIGTPEVLHAEMVEIDQRGAVLALEASDGPALLVTGPNIAGVQVDADLNLSEFDGSFMLVHHVQDARSYDFLEVEDTVMRQGRMLNGERIIFDEKPFNMPSWFRLRVVGDDTHFRGYAGDRLVTHGHDDALAPGPVGLRLDGNGRVLLDRLDIQVTR